MGLDSCFLNDFIDLKRMGALDGARRVVELGAQQLADQFLEAEASLNDIYKLYAAPRVDLGRPCGQENFTKKAPPASVFWTSLGFDYAAIDFDGHRNSHPLDLNQDQVPEHLRGKFDLVVNSGTTEHVANQENCFRVTHDLVAKGGIMFHFLPVYLLGHGLVNYSPKFFLQLFRQNDYEALFIKTRAGASRIPNYVHVMNRKWGRGTKLELDANFDIWISAAFRKRHDEAFQTPLDLPRAMMVKQYLRRLRTIKHLMPLR
jgi:SAM-dependent methyltransferase